MSIPVLQAAIATASYDLSKDLAGENAVGMYPSPRNLWKEDGVQQCPRCFLRRRLAEYSLQGRQTRACYRCLISHGLACGLAIGVDRVFAALSEGWNPVDPRARAHILSSTPDFAVESMVNCVDMRLFKQMNIGDGMPVEPYMRHAAEPALWMLDVSLPPEYQPPRWLVPFLIKMVGRENVPKSEGGEF